MNTTVRNAVVGTLQLICPQSDSIYNIEGYDVSGRYSDTIESMIVNMIRVRAGGMLGAVCI
jgi:hypothetical protein